MRILRRRGSWSGGLVSGERVSGTRRRRSVGIGGNVGGHLAGRPGWTILHLLKLHCIKKPPAAQPVAPADQPTAPVPGIKQVAQITGYAGALCGNLTPPRSLTAQVKCSAVKGAVQSTMHCRPSSWWSPALGWSLTSLSAYYSTWAGNVNIT